MTPEQRKILVETSQCLDSPLAGAINAALREIDALHAEVEVADENARRCQDRRRRDVAEAREQRDWAEAEFRREARELRQVMEGANGTNGGAMRRLWIETTPFFGDTVEDGVGGALSLAQHLHCGVSLSVNGVTIGVLPDDTIERALDLYHRLAGISPRVTPGKKG